MVTNFRRHGRIFSIVLDYIRINEVPYIRQEVRFFWIKFLLISEALGRSQNSRSILRFCGPFAAMQNRQNTADFCGKIIKLVADFAILRLVGKIRLNFAFAKIH